jgi:phage terminase large subunit-like protein
MDCVTIATKDGSIKPVKPDALKRSKRIDGVVALIMALARAVLCESDIIARGSRSRSETGAGLSSTRDEEAEQEQAA